MDDDEDKKHKKTDELEDEEEFVEKEEKDFDELDEDLKKEEKDEDNLNEDEKEVEEDEKKIEDPFDEDSQDFGKGSERKRPDDENIEIMDESEADKIEEERDDKKGVDDFEELTDENNSKSDFKENHSEFLEEDDAEPLVQDERKALLDEDKTEPLYRPEQRTESYYQQMRNESEGHIPSLGSMNNSSHFSQSNLYGREGKPQKGNKWHVLILIIIGLAVIGGTVYFLKNSFNVGMPALPFLSEATPTPAPTAAPATPAPTATPTPIERSDYKLEILNGTSTSGLAASTSSKLQDLGYEVVRVGNATNSAFEATIVRVKPDALNLAEQIIRDLSPEFVGVLDATLPEDEANDSVIILGPK